MVKLITILFLLLDGFYFNNTITLKIYNIQTDCVFDLVELNKLTLYVGSKKLENGTQRVTGLEFKKKSDSTINYRYTELYNWEKILEIKGDAKIKCITETDKFYDSEKVAYKLVDSANNITILITSNNYITQTKAQLFNNTKKIESEVMHKK